MNTDGKVEPITVEDLNDTSKAAANDPAGEHKDRGSLD
jgi:hypothetical protein